MRPEIGGYKERDPERWTPRTLADEIYESTADEAGQEIMVRCDCGRRARSWEAVDCRNLPPKIRGEDAPWKGRAYVCSGCWTRWVREGLVTKSEWVEAHGGPQALVKHFRGKPIERKG